MPTVFRQHQIPHSTLTLSTFDQPDYVDMFVAAVAIADYAAPSAEEWARAGAGDSAGAAGQFVWRVILGLRLAPLASRDHVAGWRIDGHGPDWVRLEASSWCLTAQIVVQANESSVSIATFIRYDRPLARAVWAPVAVGHRLALPGILQRAVRSKAATTAQAAPR